MKSQNHEQIIEEAIENFKIQKALFSNPFIKSENAPFKIEVRPLIIKHQKLYQVTEYIGTQTFHKNCKKEEFKSLLNHLFSTFKQTFLRVEGHSFQILTNKKGGRKILKTKEKENLLTIKADLSHNKKKQYLLEEGIPYPFLVELGILTESGKILPKKNDKFRQLNRFLEMIEDVTDAFIENHRENRELRIIDFGCGKAYLTFALYHYLEKIKGYRLNVTGLDLKKEVVLKCEQLARKLNFKGLQFEVGDINQYENSKPVDLVVSLHACDTATDAALLKAIHWKAKVILSVPCCQHELFSQIKNESLTPLLKHGILKERFAALVTDAARAEILEIMGYETQVLEFIDLEHTPKNLLIRAIMRKSNPLKFNKNKNKKTDLVKDKYLKFKKELKINPFIEKAIKNI